MEIIKKTISLEKGKSRAEGELYGSLTATSFYFKIQLSQSVDDMGMFSDFSFIPAPILNRELTMIEKQLRLSGSEVSHWFDKGGKISGTTDTKLETLKSYNINVPYQVGFDIEKETYINFENNLINGVSRITQFSGDSVIYTFDASNDLNIGTENQITGILYGENLNESGTTLSFQSEGWNETNTELMAITKEEYLMGIINPPEVENDVFIDRGNVTVMENHLRMSEIESLDHLVRYGNGFFNIVRQ